MILSLVFAACVCGECDIVHVFWGGVVLMGISIWGFLYSPVQGYVYRYVYTYSYVYSYIVIVQ